MNKKTIRRALKRAEYMDSIGKFGAVGAYFNGHSYCIIGCLFSDDLIRYLNNEGDVNKIVSALYRKYPKLESLLGMSGVEADKLQSVNDFGSTALALNMLREWAK